MDNRHIEAAEMLKCQNRDYGNVKGRLRGYSRQDVTVFNGQYPPLTAKHITVFHDRFLIIDETDGYHLGASIKDAGKKCFGINRIEDSKTIQELIDKARTQSTAF